MGTATIVLAYRRLVPGSGNQPLDYLLPVGHGNNQFDCEFGGSTIAHFSNRTGSNS
jgi:hypothetical protein